MSALKVLGALGCAAVLAVAVTEATREEQADAALHRQVTSKTHYHTPNRWEVCVKQDNAPAGCWYTTQRIYDLYQAGGDGTGFLRGWLCAPHPRPTATATDPACPTSWDGTL